MKSAKYILLASIILSGVIFADAPVLPDSTFVDDSTVVTMSGEAQLPTPPVSLYSAPDQPAAQNASGEINITIPFNPNEVDKPVAWTPDVPRNINLNSASNVGTGPELNVLMALILSLLASGFIYTRTRRHIK